MKVLKIRAYTVDELPEEIQEKIHENFYDINISDDWWMPTFEAFNEKIQKDYGLEADPGRVEFDLYRYAKLRYSVADARKLLLALIPAERVAAFEFKRDARIEDLVDIWIEDGRRVFASIDPLARELDGDIDEIDSCVEDLLSDLDREFLRALEEEYEYLTSREAVIETINASGWLFTRDGKRLDHLLLEGWRCTRKSAS